MELNILVYLQIKKNSQQHCRALCGNSGDSSTFDTQLRSKAQAKDKDWVENYVQEGANGLGNHAIKGLAGGNKQPLKGNLAKYGNTKKHTYKQIIAAVFDNGFNIGLAGEEESGAN